MTHTKLLATASAVTAIIGIVSFNLATADAQTPDGFGSVGKQVLFRQADWNGAADPARPAVDLATAATKDPANWKTFWDKYIHEDLQFPGATGLRLVQWKNYRANHNLQVKAGIVEGKKNGNIENDYFISDGFSSSTGDSVYWQAITFEYRAANRDALTLSYRVGDSLTNDADADDWQQATIRFVNKNQIAKIKISPEDGQGKYLQFKVHASKPNNFLNAVTVVAQPIEDTTPDDDGNGDGDHGNQGTPSPTPSGSPSPEVTSTTVGRYKAVQQAWRPLVQGNAGVKVVNTESEIFNDRYCQLADDPVVRSYRWNNSYKLNGVANIATRGDQNQVGIVGINGRSLKNSFVISHGLTFDTGPIVRWDGIDIEFDKDVADTLKVYYRLFDDPSSATKKANDPSWIELADPTTVDPIDCGSTYMARYRVDRNAKYIQYKFHVVSKKVRGRVQKQVVRRINIGGTTLRNITISPSPSPLPSPTVSVSPTPIDEITPTPTAGGKGRITVLTKVLNIPTPSPSPTDEADGDGPLLPPSSSPSAAATPSVPPVSSLCFSQYDTEPAPEVELTVKEKRSDGFVGEDQLTDDEGVWRGLDDQRDEFNAGRYDVTFGDHNPDELALVAFCVEPNDDRYYVQTAMDVKKKLAAINVLPGAETRLIALYAPRSKPFVKLEKFALAGSIDKDGNIIDEKVRKKLKTVNPGQIFLYRIAYENNAVAGATEGDAKNILIQDVIPEGLELPDVVVENPELYDIEIRYHTAKNQTIVSRKVDILKPGETGYIDIPVRVNASLFPVK